MAFAISGVRSVKVDINLGPMVGVWSFSLNNGWGEKGAHNWRIHESDLAALRELAESRAGGKPVHICGRSPGRKRKARRPTKDERQATFEWDKG